MDLLTEILAARESRMFKIQNSLAAYPGSSVVSVKLNIPGSRKISPAYQAAFKIVEYELKDKLAGSSVGIIAAERNSSAAGYDALYVLSSQPLTAIEIKYLLIELENKDPLGRLFDLDLWHNEVVSDQPDSPCNTGRRCTDNQEGTICGQGDASQNVPNSQAAPEKLTPVQIKRNDLGLAGRKCLICDNDAVICSRGKRHNLTKLLDKIDSLIQSDVRIKNNNIGEYD